MNMLNEERFSTAVALGSTVCSELGICCNQRGRIIFQIYRKLEELKGKEPVILGEIEDSNSDAEDV
ncbi:hypothetical protein ACFLUP_02225 [Chloroflexota bacterium]